MTQDHSPGSVVLDFSSEAAPTLPNDLSAVARIGKTLWLASDEGAHLDRLVETAPGQYGQRKQLPLEQIFATDGEERDDDGSTLKPAAEMDLEGLAIDGQDGGPWSLWMVGSHATTRKDPMPDTMSRTKALKRLAKTERPSNRFFLGRVPLVLLPDQTFDIPSRSDITDGSGPETFAFDRKESALVDLLRDDPHLKRFVKLPSKENGLDIEGLAVRGNRIFLGCRGPVLRGYAVIIELSLQSESGQLRAQKLEGKQHYRKYFLPLGGLGTRSILLDGEDMLILAGPTMPVGVPSQVYRWQGAMRHEESAVIAADELELLGDLPANMDDDRPEAIEHWSREEGARSLMVVHDTPAPGRVDKIRKTILADVIELDQTPDTNAMQTIAPGQADNGQSNDDQDQSFTVMEGVKVKYHPPGTKLPDPQ